MHHYNKFPKAIRKIFEAIVIILPHTRKINHLLRKIKKVIYSASLDPELRYVSLNSLGYTELQKKELLKDAF